MSVIKSLHSKIVFWSTSVVGIILLAFSIESILLTRNKLIDDLDNKLKSEATEIAHTLAIENGEIKIIHDIEWKEPHHTTDTENPIYILFIDTNKTEQIQSKNFENIPKPISKLSYSKENILYKTLQANGVLIRYSSLPYFFHNQHYGWVITGITFKSIYHVQNVLITIYSIAFPIAMIIAFLGSSLLARKAVAPVQNISDTVRRIHSANLDQTLSVPETYDEIAYLAITINELLQRLQESFKTIRRFTADASHELKTPLAVIQSELEQIQSDIKDNDCSMRTERIQLELSRMTKIIDDLSTLAKADTHQLSIQIQTVWLNDLIHDEVKRYRKVADEKGTQIICSDLPSISIDGDPHWIGVMISNILDNAIKFSPTDSRVYISLKEPKPDSVTLQVSDQGSGVDESEIPNITKRFYRRKKSSQIPGSGLGLSIVDWVVSAHQGNLTFENNPGRGLTVTVTLPAKSGSVG